MGNLTIAIDIHVGGRDFTSDIEWRAGQDEIRNVLDFVARLADQNGIAPEALTHSILRFIATMGWRSSPNDYETQKMAVLYTVLQSQMPNRDAAIHTCVASEDIGAILMVRDAFVTVQVKDRMIDTSPAALAS